jgi:hypothetical protein
MDSGTAIPARNESSPGVVYRVRWKDIQGCSSGIAETTLARIARRYRISSRPERVSMGWDGVELGLCAVQRTEGQTFGSCMTNQSRVFLRQFLVSPPRHLIPHRLYHLHQLHHLTPFSSSPYTLPLPPLHTTRPQDIPVPQLTSLSFLYTPEASTSLALSFSTQSWGLSAIHPPV